MPYPSVRPKPDGNKAITLPTGPYGVTDVMVHGLQSASTTTNYSHPLEHSEKHWNENKQKMDYVMLRNTIGVHAPLKLQMEKHVALKMQRLPGLPSSNLMMDTLTGRDDMIEFEDFLGDPVNSERMGHPHVMMEKQLNIL
ncbi:hypothetical protein KUTeg_023989 [Tegillarca granosa]|uniref:Proteasome maturation protein n=1 Tax=Tegillarca granosa TaxID=220873 RepID=A0ABQ9DW16_TEGGR|nr:hypothetical protein KUTeg_023989 [Tegillarca granosa]